MNIRYPDNLDKYAGGISKRNDSYRYRVELNGRSHSKTFETLEEAQDYQIQYSIANNLVQNVCFDMDDHYEMAVGERWVKIDKDDFVKLDNYNWTAAKCSNLYYATGDVNGSRIRMHNYIMNFAPIDGWSIDHINRDSLDNRKANLRIANTTIQAINKNIRSDNTTGIVGVFKCNSNWCASWSENKIARIKSFSVRKYGEDQAKQLAINFRAQKEHTIADYVNAK